MTTTPRPSLPIVVALGLFVVYAATVATEVVINDATSAALAAWRIGTTGTPWFDGFALADVRTDQPLWTGLAANGHVAVFRSPGVIAAAVPAYWVAGGGTGPGDFSVLPGALTAAALTAAACGLLLSTALRHLPRPVAVAGVLALGLATPLWTVGANALHTHSVTVFAVALMAWAADRDLWWLVGLAGGVGLWGRLHVAVVVAVVGLLVGWWRRDPRLVAAVAVPSAALMGLASLWSRWVYGTWSPSGGYPDATAYADRVAGGGAGGPLDLLANQAGLWVSPDRGLLVWSPAVLLLLPALARSWRTLPDWSRALLVGGLVYAVVQGLMNGFHGGSTFYGYRLTLEVLAAAAPALLLSLPATGPRARRLLGPVVGLMAAAIALGAVNEGVWVSAAYAWTDNAFALALRTVPALWLWAVLGVVVGHLAGAVWRERAGRRPDLGAPDQDAAGLSAPAAAPATPPAPPARRP